MSSSGGDSRAAKAAAVASAAEAVAAEAVSESPGWEEALEASVDSLASALQQLQRPPARLHYHELDACSTARALGYARCRCASVCASTGGYCVANGVVVKGNARCLAALPSLCIVACLRRLKLRPWPHAPRQTVAFWDLDGRRVASFKVATSLTLRSLHCSGQKLFLLLTGPFGAQLLVTDLAGSKLRHLQLSDPGARHLACTKDKLYFVSDTSILCLAMDTCKRVFARDLRRSLSNAVGAVAVAGGLSLLVATPAGVHRVSTDTGQVKQVMWQHGPPLTALAACQLDQVFVAARDGSLTELSSGGRQLRTKELPLPCACAPLVPRSALCCIGGGLPPVTTVWRMP